MNHNKKHSSIRFEMIIIFVIAACMIFLIDFTHDKMHDFARLEQEALLISHDPDNPVHNELAEQIIEYRPGTYKMIEIYKPNFEIMMTLQFIPDAEYETNLTDHKELMDLFYNNDEGHTQLKIGDHEEDIYFRWIHDTDEEKYLMVIYATREPVRNLEVFDFVCYLVILLACILLIRLCQTRYSDKIKQYRNVSDDVRNRLMH